MLNETDFKIEKMKMLKIIGDAIHAFSDATGATHIEINSRCTHDSVMTIDKKMHDGLNIVFSCDIYNPEWDNDEDYE